MSGLSQEGRVKAKFEVLSHFKHIRSLTLAYILNVHYPVRGNDMEKKFATAEIDRERDRESDKMT